MFETIEATNEKKHRSKPTNVIATKKKSMMANVCVILPASSCKLHIVMPMAGNTVSLASKTLCFKRL